MAFHEVQFPTAIAYGASGGPIRKTDIVTLDSGYEQRNQAWINSRHRYNVSYGVKSYDLIHALKAFWEARAGALHGFRFKDWADYKSCAPQQALSHQDQVIGTGDGVITTFQLVKAYTSGGNTYTRTINKPVSGTVRVAKNTTEQLSGWTVNTTTGVVTFTVAPTMGTVIKAGYEFDVPVRFEADMIVIDLEGFRQGTMPDINLLEIRL